MKILSLTLFVAGIALAPQASAVEPGVPVQTVNACNDLANQHMLAAGERDAYVEQCLGPSPLAAPGSSASTVPLQLQAGCEQQANAHGLAVADRGSFMQACLAAKNRQSLTIAAVPVEKINGCVEEANEHRLRDANRQSFLRECLAD